MNPTLDYSRIPLRDIHVPDAVGWWPPAVGWWLLALLVVAAVALLAYRYRRAYRKRAALAAIERALGALDGGEDPAHCAQRISTVLRRFAMSAHGRHEDVAGLTGRAWLEYLDSRWERRAFASGAGRTLLVAPYAPVGRIPAESVHELGAVCREWIGAQRAGA